MRVPDEMLAAFTEDQLVHLKAVFLNNSGIAACTRPAPSTATSCSAPRPGWRRASPAACPRSGPRT
ncbi:hypothetical protein ACFQ3Z_01520 [Streptomyces nogalater]